VARLCAEVRLRPLTGRVLVGRGFDELDRVGRFLAPRLGDMRPPEGVADLDRALARLARAIDGRERIGVFGDYDVDGITTAAVLASGLGALGAGVLAEAADRFSGYGLSPERAARFADAGCTLLVTGDCGTSDVAAIQFLRQRAVDTIVIDHHQVPSGASPAYALINPHRSDDAFPFKGLASCGLGFYMIAALRTRMRAAGDERAVRFDPRSLLDLVALGTIADVVPLVDENRILVAAGLRAVGQGARPGIRALTQVAEIAEGSAIDAQDVSFRLAPRLNAAGRLGSAQVALDLLLSPDADTAARLARDLDDLNRKRQQIQEDVLGHALADAEARMGVALPPAALVVAGQGLHLGVVGIVAAKLVDRFGVPAIVVGLDGQSGRGSARTVPGFNLYRALSACGAHLLAYGGHAMAAGLTISTGAVDAFRDAFVAQAQAFRDGLGRPGPFAVDAVAGLAELDLAGALELVRLAPFGCANAEPLIALRGVTATSTRVVGKGHLALTLSQGRAFADAIGFGMAEQGPGDGQDLDVIGIPEISVWRGERRARFRVKRFVMSPAPAIDQDVRAE
jgi:single-stranded-DNA-specific exonuclease